jgi:hypothetical protein
MLIKNPLLAHGNYFRLTLAKHGVIFPSYVCESPGGLARRLASGAGKWRRGASGVVTLWRAHGVRRARSGARVHVTGTSGRVAFWHV